VISLSVCLSFRLRVCPRAYIRNHTYNLNNFLCMLPIAVARSFSGGAAIRYVLPVLQMTSYLHMPGIGDTIKA